MSLFNRNVKVHIDLNTKKHPLQATLQPENVWVMKQFMSFHQYPGRPSNSPG
ncbi:hypothetical protein M758_3G202300 [Ceratodon purpureus]|nr:hypothetical protein M758_3G202300 [Ceratodon purpureus]